MEILHLAPCQKVDGNVDVNVGVDECADADADAW